MLVAVDRAGTVVGPDHLESVRAREHDQATAEAARALRRADDGKPGASARVDRALDLVLILAGHATHHSPISWL
jgi:hypothetical protein